MGNNLFTFFLEKPDTDASRIFMQTGDGQVWTYQDVTDWSAKFANGLCSIGVRNGDRVAVQVRKCPEALMLYLGTLRCGAVFLPLNTAYTAGELRYFIGDSEPTLIVCCPEDAAGICEIAEDLGVAQVETLDDNGTGSLLDRFSGSSPQFETSDVSGDSLAAILYTSGTTGRSKGAMLTHDNLTSNAVALAETWQFSKADRLLHALPIFHTHGLFTATNTILQAGASMIFLNKFDAEEMIRHLPEATTMMGVPTFYSRLLSHPEFNRELVEHIRLFVSGSAPLSAEVHKAFEDRTGHAILERYGMTETGMNTSNPYEGERRAGTVGFPLPGVEVRIADPQTGAELPQGEIGSIEIRGPNVFKGYWRQPDKTSKEFREDGFFISGDLGFVDEQGYIHISGRDKDLIITGGFNVYPAEIETIIDGISGVAESAVIGVPHPDFGEGVTAVVALRENSDLQEQDLLAALDGQLAKFKVPKRFLFVDQLPRNAMGKIQKKELRERFSDTFQG